jgi:hypothetical protein
MTDTTDDYTFWRAALAGILGPITERNPQPGFYRLRGVRGGPWLPVAIWRDGETTLCLVGQESREPERVWLQCARFPVAEDAYRQAATTGTWPGGLDEPAADGAEAPAPAMTEPPPPIGDNRMPADDGEVIIANIDELAARIDAWLAGRTIESQTDAERAEALIGEVTKIGKAAEHAHKVEKAPHLEAGRRVDNRWKPVIDRAANAVRSLKAALTPFLRARDAEKRAEAAKAIAAGADVARADVRASTSGIHGRKVSLRTKKRAVVKDYPAALQFFAEHPEVKDLVQRLADKVAGVGGTVPGVEVVTEQVAA